MFIFKKNVWCLVRSFSSCSQERQLIYMWCFIGLLSLVYCARNLETDLDSYTFEEYQRGTRFHSLWFAFSYDLDFGYRFVKGTQEYRNRIDLFNAKKLEVIAHNKVWEWRLTIFNLQFSTPRRHGKLHSTSSLFLMKWNWRHSEAPNWRARNCMSEKICSTLLTN
jgi:hypothetical protein